MNTIVIASLALLFAIGLGLLAFGSIRAAWRGIGRRRGTFAALAAFAVVATICAQKPGPTPVITVDAFLRDAGCYATNDVFHAAVTNAPSYAGVDFSDCDLMVYARERASSDAASWFELTPRKKFSQQPADYAIEDATNYNYLVYLDYVPPSPVHTNGVFELRGFMVPGDEPGNLEQLAAGFINSRAILPPPTARDYVQDGLIAMWDGIENAGWGVHISSGKWVDLIGGLQSYTTAEFTENANIAHIGVAGIFEFSNDEKFSRIVNNFTVEVVLVDGGWSNFTYAHSLQWLIRDTNNGLKTLFQASVPSADSITDARYFFNKPGIVDLGSLTPVPGGGYARALTQTFDGTSCKAFRCGVFEDQYDGALTWSPVIGTLQYKIRVYNSGSIFKYHALRVYSRALTASEIEHNYKIDKERFNLP